MSKHAKQSLSLLSLRVICGACAVMLHAWFVSSPLFAQEQLQTQAPASPSVLSFAITAMPATAPPQKALAKPVQTASPQAKLVTRTDKSVEMTRKPEQLPAPESPPALPARAARSDATLQAVSALGVHELVEMTEPKFVSPPSPPSYPTVARKRGQEGTVWVDIELDAKGKQARLEILRSSGIAVLDSAALTAVSHWRFRPYEVSGVGRPSRVRIPIEFALN